MKTLVLACAVALLAAFAATAAQEKKPDTATATIEARSGSKVSGTATATQTDGTVKIVVQAEGLTEGMHAVHIHEKGDCSAPDALSAGGHFNPTNEKHGAPTDPEHHAGDFGNMRVGADGKGTLEIEPKTLTVAPGPNSVVGRAIVIHEKVDDFVTQPAGNAGARVGCGVFK